MPNRPVWAEVSLQALRHNYREIKKQLAAGVKLCAVVKANAYGHGAVEFAAMMQQAGDQVATSQTTREVMNAKVAVNRNDYCQTLEAMLDEAFGYADAGENQRALYDVYKGILEQIVAAIPYMQYYRLKTNDEELFAAFLESADNHISKNIVDPVMKYLDGDDILDDALDLAFEDFDVDELVELEDAELENLLSTYIYQCFNRKLNSYAKKYAADTVDAVVADLEGK